MIFDWQRTRWTFSDEGGRLRRCLAPVVTEGKPIGNHASHDLQDVICAWLVGLDHEVQPVLSRALEHLDKAIALDEEFGENRDFHRVTLRWARSLGVWLASAVNESQEWAQVAYYKQAYWSSEAPPLPKTAIVRYDLDDYMAYCVQAGKYADGIEICDRLIGDRKISLGKRPKPREVAYAVCQQQLSGKYSEDDVFEAGRRMLQANLEQDWLGAGQYIRAATWLKIVYWDPDVRAGRLPTLTPLQTILKAYENMPQVAQPEFIQQAASKNR
jgi:hypothetical protein